MQMLEDINAEGTTIIMVTHDPELAVRARRNIQILDGSVSDLDEMMHRVTEKVTAVAEEA